MVKSSQHVMQIMETQTGFDLRTALESWRHEMANQPNFTAEDQGELEGHLRDAMADLRQRGLNDEEAFWLARRRIGKPQQLAEEFAKGDPAGIWRARLFWIALGLLAWAVWAQFVNAFWNLLVTNPHPLIPDWVRFYFPHWFDEILRSFYFRPIVLMLSNLLPFFGIGMRLVKGRPIPGASLWHFVSKSRLRFGVTALIVVFLLQCVVIGFRPALWTHQMSAINLFVMTVFSAFWPLTLVGVVAWLLPIGRPVARQVP